MSKTNLPEKLIDAVYTRLYSQALPGILTYVQKIEHILSRYLGQLLAEKAETECDCGMVGCMDMIDGKCHLCREAYNKACEPCNDALQDSDTYLDAQADLAEIVDEDPEHCEYDATDEGWS